METGFEKVQVELVCRKVSEQQLCFCSLKSVTKKVIIANQCSVDWLSTPALIDWRRWRRRRRRRWAKKAKSTVEIKCFHPACKFINKSEKNLNSRNQIFKTKVILVTPALLNLWSALLRFINDYLTSAASDSEAHLHWAPFIVDLQGQCQHQVTDSSPRLWSFWSALRLRPL